jgi:hypothetical protein
VDPSTNRAHADGDEDLVEEDGTYVLVGPAPQVIAHPTAKVEGIHLLADDVHRALAVTDMARGHQGLGQVRQKRPVDLLRAAGGIGVAGLEDVEGAVVGVVVEVAEQHKILLIEVAFEPLNHGPGRPLTPGIGGGPASSPRLAMVHHDDKRRRLIRELHGDRQQIAPIGEERLRLVREEEMLVVRVQIGRQSDDPERFADRDRQILDVRAVIIDHQVTLHRRKDECKGRAIGDLLQANDMGVEDGDHLAQLAEAIALVDHVGTEELNIIRGHADLCAPRGCGDEEDGDKPRPRGCHEPPVLSHETSPLSVACQRHATPTDASPLLATQGHAAPRRWAGRPAQ